MNSGVVAFHEDLLRGPTHGTPIDVTPVLSLFSVHIPGPLPAMGKILKVDNKPLYDAAVNITHLDMNHSVNDPVLINISILVDLLNLAHDKKSLFCQF